MTNRERVFSALNHKQTDICPYSVDFTIKLLDKMIAFTGNKDFQSSIGNHIDAVACLRDPREIRPGYFEDVFGVIWNRTVDRDIGIVNDYPVKEPDISKVKMPELDIEYIKSKLNSFLYNGSTNFKIANLGFSMFERAWTLCGMENLLMWMVTEESFVHSLFDMITVFNLMVIDEALKYPIDCFMFGDDWGQQKNLITGKPYWRKFILPGISRMYSRVKSAGRFTAQHSCGDIHEILPDLIDAGLDIYQTVQPEIYDLKTLKTEYGSYLTFWGGISTQKFLPFASPALVKDKVRETIDIMSRNGGYIAAPTHAMPPDIPEQNVEALIDALKNQ